MHHRRALALMLTLTAFAGPVAARVLIDPEPADETYRNEDTDKWCGYGREEVYGWKSKGYYFSNPEAGQTFFGTDYNDAQSQCHTWADTPET